MQTLNVFTATANVKQQRDSDNSVQKDLSETDAAQAVDKKDYRLRKGKSSTTTPVF